MIASHFFTQLGDVTPPDFGLIEIARHRVPIQPYLKLAPQTKSISVELIYRDCGVSETKTFRRCEALGRESNRAEEAGTAAVPAAPSA